MTNFEVLTKTEKLIQAVSEAKACYCYHECRTRCDGCDMHDEETCLLSEAMDRIEMYEQAMAGLRHASMLLNGGIGDERHEN